MPDTSNDCSLPAALANPARRALAGAGIASLKDLVAWMEADVRQFHRMGPKSIPQLRERLAARGLSFAIPIGEHS